jgi:hypothetical protein
VAVVSYYATTYDTTLLHDKAYTLYIPPLYNYDADCCAERGVSKQ